MILFSRAKSQRSAVQGGGELTSSLAWMGTEGWWVMMMQLQQSNGSTKTWPISLIFSDSWLPATVTLHSKSYLQFQQSENPTRQDEVFKLSECFLLNSLWARKMNIECSYTLFAGETDRRCHSLSSCQAKILVPMPLSKEIIKVNLFSIGS